MRNAIMIFLVCYLSFTSGCATFRKAEQAAILEMENKELQRKLKQLQQSKNEEVNRVLQEKEGQLQDLEMVKLALEEQLRKEIGEYKAKLQMTERGLVITFLAEVFFDSGKDILREDGAVSLGKVAQVLNENVPDSYISIEGHTDSDPIKYSDWKSNWELSSARALAVVHYLINHCKVKPNRLSGVGCGEYRPVVSNDTAAGKQQNRRVEIIILPAQVQKIKG
ncbi:MAG: flagellar motor protein MotB [Candidatus Omnitrophota bacterium]